MTIMAPKYPARGMEPSSRELDKDRFLNTKKTTSKYSPKHHHTTPFAKITPRRYRGLVAVTWKHFRRARGKERLKSADSYYRWYCKRCSWATTVCHDAERHLLLDHNIDVGRDPERLHGRFKLGEEEWGVNKEELSAALLNVITTHKLRNLKWPVVEKLLLAANPRIGATFVQSRSEVSEMLGAAKSLYELSCGMS
jgi:hypothetical protein